MADIFAGIASNDVRAVEALVAADKKVVSAKNAAGRLPIHMAAALGQRETVDLLLKAKAKINAKTKEHLTAAQLAAIAGHLELAKHLISLGGDINTCPPNGSTLLHDMDLHGIKPEVAEALLDLGMDAGIICTAYRRNRTVLHALAASDYPKTTPQQRYRLACKMIRQGAKVDAIDSEHETALHIAALNGNIAVVQALVENGASLEQADQDGATPLLYAVSGGHLATVRYLLDRGASPAARLLQAAGILAGNTPLVMAHKHGYRYIGRLLAERSGVVWTEPDLLVAAELHRACWNGDVDDVRMILDDDPSMALRMFEFGLVSAYPLHRAACVGNVQIGQMLLDAGTPADAGTQPFDGTPLEDAIKQNHPGFVKLLVKAGANVNRKGSGKPPLHEAAYWGHHEIVRILLDAGANANVTDGEERTALHVAEASLARDYRSASLATGAVERDAQELRGLRDTIRTLSGRP